jgi:hypothetical protein
VQLGVVQVRDGPEQRERHVLADHGGGLEQALLGRRQPVDARGEHRPDGRRDADRFCRLGRPVRAPLAHESAALHQVADALLQEERISARPLYQ